MPLDGLNALLSVEAGLNRLPLSALDLSCGDNDPDGGVDAKVQWPPGNAHDVLSAGENVLQYKAGKLSVKRLRIKFRKPGVQAALRTGSQFVLLSGHDYSEPSATVLRKELRKLCKSRRIDPARCTIYFGSQIARWVSRHPSVLIMPELGLGFPAFLTGREWLQIPDLTNPWKPDASRTEVTDKVRSFIARETDFYVLRLEGPAGVGKTRAALEGARAAGSGLIMYTPDADNPNVTDLLTRIQGDPTAYATVIVDECDNDRQGRCRRRDRRSTVEGDRRRSALRGWLRRVWFHAAKRWLRTRRKEDHDRR